MERHSEIEPVTRVLALGGERVAQYEATVVAARSRAKRPPRKPSYLEDVEEDGIELPPIMELPERGNCSVCRTRLLPCSTARQ